VNSLPKTVTRQRRDLQCFSPDSSVFSALQTFVIIALYKSTFTIPYRIGATLRSPPLFRSGMCNFSSNFLLPEASEAFCGLKYAENAIAAELTTLPLTPSWLGRGHPSPYPTPLGAFGASMLAPSAPRSSCPPDTKSWRHHWSPPLFKVKLRQCHTIPYRQ